MQQEERDEIISGGVEKINNLIEEARKVKKDLDETGFKTNCKAILDGKEVNIRVLGIKELLITKAYYLDRIRGYKSAINDFNSFNPKVFSLTFNPEDMSRENDMLRDIDRQICLNTINTRIKDLENKLNTLKGYYSKEKRELDDINDILGSL